jgi:hypothetical protein
MPTARIPKTKARGKPKPNLDRRGQHLVFVRQLPCVACGKAAPSEAAHACTATDGGVGMKPTDRYAVPLVQDMPCETASDGRAFLLVRAPHRSPQRVIAPMDDIGRPKGREAHCLSGATIHQSGDCIWLSQRRVPAGIGDFFGSGFAAVARAEPRQAKCVRPHLLTVELLGDTNSRTLGRLPHEVIRRIRPVLIWVTPAGIMVKLAERRVDGCYSAHHSVAHD